MGTRQQQFPRKSRQRHAHTDTDTTDSNTNTIMQHPTIVWANKHNQMHWPKDTALLPTMEIRHVRRGVGEVELGG